MAITPKNVNEFLIETIIDYMGNPREKEVCLEDQYYKIDKFPKLYEVDDDLVYECTGCGHMVLEGCLTECDICEKNFCDFTHSHRSKCKKTHTCGSTMLHKKIHASNFHYTYTWYQSVCYKCKPKN